MKKELFTKGEQVFVKEILNCLIPPGNELPGAGEIRIVEYLNDILNHSTELKRTFAYIFKKIQIESKIINPEDFKNIPNSKKENILKKIEKRFPECFYTLILHAYNGYYINSTVTNLLGIYARPPQPLGYDIEQGDLGLTKNVISRGKLYREIN